MTVYVTDLQPAGVLSLLNLRMEVFTNCSSRPSDPEHQSKKMGIARSRFEKNAIRVCGNWSEQLSSKGKIYFYNCITEVSQWQKPSEWSLRDLEQDELIKIFGKRDNVEGNVLKRPRIFGTTAATLAKEDGNTGRASPKRNKTCDYSDSEKRYLMEDRTEYVPHSVSSYIPRNRLTPRQRNHRDSPKFDGAPSLYSKRDQSGIFPCPNPPDDMEISPDSSPLSEGSSPLDSNNPHSPRRVRCRPGAASRSTKRSVCAAIKTNSTVVHSSDNCAKSDNSSNTLRQLLDVIRDSIDGLVDPSPCSISGQKVLMDSTSANGLNRKQMSDFHAKSSSSVHVDPSIFNNHNVENSVANNVYGKPSKSSRVAPTEFRSRTDLHSTSKEVMPTQLSSLSPAEGRVSTQDKSMSGLVSTLSTLVNLIGTRHTNNHPSGSEDKSRTSMRHLSASSVSTYNQPFTRPHPMQQPVQSRFTNQQLTFSPMTASPVNTGASSSGGSSGSMLNNYSTGISVYSHNVDDHVSGSDRVTGLSKFRALSNTSYELSSPLNTRNSASPSEPLGIGNRNPRSIYPSKDPAHTIFYDEDRQRSNTVELINHNTEYMRFDGRDFNCRALNRIPLASDSSSSPSGVFCPNRVSASAYTECSPVSSHGSITNKPSVTCSREPPVVYFTDNKRHCPSFEKPEFTDKLWPSLNVSDTQFYVNLSLCFRYRDAVAERLEVEAQVEAKRFDRLHSVLYGELSAESKKLRALVRISEAKLALHKEKQSSLQELMDAIESHRPPANPSFPDDVI